MPAYTGGGGGNIITWPSTGVPWPKSVEPEDNYLDAANTNPFNAEQQIQDWGNRFARLSVSFASLTQAQAAVLIAFLNSLNGRTNVFQFPSAFASAVPEILLTPFGGTQPYWRRDSSITKQGMVKPGGVYSNITFEVRQAI